MNEGLQSKVHARLEGEPINDITYGYPQVSWNGIDDPLKRKFVELGGESRVMDHHTSSRGETRREPFFLNFRVAVHIMPDYPVQ